MGVEQLGSAIATASAGAEGASITLPYDVLHAISGLDLDTDSSKLAVGAWAKENGYQIEHDAKNREVKFKRES
jgi:hypothetical protein